MSNGIKETTNKHDSWLGSDWHTDVGIDQKLHAFILTPPGGMSGEEMSELLDEAGDYGQVTEREYSAMKRWVDANFVKLSPEARKLWEKFDASMQDAGGIGTAEKHHSTNEVVVTSGPELQSLLKDISAMAQPPAALPSDHVQPPTTQAPAELPVPEPPPPPPEPAVPADIKGPRGNSWGAIFAYIMQILDDKEKGLKDKITEKAKEMKGKEGGDFQILQTDLLALQDELKSINQMFSLVTNMMTALHDTIMKGVNNVRV
jgi:hypothetical protein